MLPNCPHCGTDYVRRTDRDGVVERALSFAFLYPFRCQLCTHRFRSIQWGVRYAEDFADKREYERLATRVPATFSGDQIQGEGIVTDLSLGGCTLEATVRFFEGTTLRLELKTSERKPVVTVDAVVVRSVRPTCVGLQFVHLRPDQQERLSRFVSDKLGLKPAHLR